MKADIGDFETSRGYPLDLSADLASTEIPGYEGCSAALQAAYNALPLGAQFVIRTGIATIHAGAVFRKTSQTLYGAGGRITRVVNPTVDTITAGSAVDSFITNLVATGGADSIVIGGTLLNGNGAANAAGTIKVFVGGIAACVLSVGTITSASNGTTFTVSAAGGGAVFTCQANSSGVFAATFSYSNTPGATSVPVSFEYLGITTRVVASVT